MPLLSICIPTYNRCSFLMKNLHYFLERNSSEIEVVISDNASTDDTYQCVTQLIEERQLSNFRYYRNDVNIGPDANFSKVLELSEGNYSLLLGDDDFLQPDFLNVLLPFIKENSTASFICLSSKEMIRFAKNKKSQQFDIDQLGEFFTIVGPHITFMSLMIFNTSVLQTVLKKGFHYADNLYQSFLAVTTIKKNSSLPYHILYYMPFAYNGETTAANYDFYTVFVDKVLELYQYGLPAKSIREINAIYQKSFMFFLFKFTIILKAIRVNPKLRRNNYICLRSMPMAWIAVFPCYVVPSFIWSGLYDLFRKMKKKCS